MEKTQYIEKEIIVEIFVQEQEPLHVIVFKLEFSCYWYL